MAGHFEIYFSFSLSNSAFLFYFHCFIVRSLLVYSNFLFSLYWPDFILSSSFVVVVVICFFFSHIPSPPHIAIHIKSTFFHFHSSMEWTMANNLIFVVLVFLSNKPTPSLFLSLSLSFQSFSVALFIYVIFCYFRCFCRISLRVSFYFQSLWLIFSNLVRNFFFFLSLHYRVPHNWVEKEKGKRRKKKNGIHWTWNVTKNVRNE